MSYTAEQFIEDVKKEARALREHATKEELSILDLEELDPADHNSCIYGQMTGDCCSERAANLIFTCCCRYFDNMGRSNFEGMRDIVAADLGRSPDDIENANSVHEQRVDELIFLSSIESYILLPNAKIANLIAYLKGETDTLDL